MLLSLGVFNPVEGFSIFLIVDDGLLHLVLFERTPVTCLPIILSLRLLLISVGRTSPFYPFLILYGLSSF